MNNNINDFNNKFKKIKKIGLTPSLRPGNTGIGFTYESLINKKEDNSYTPDYKGIEIKTTLGYSKSSITLFTLVPQTPNAIKYLYNNYGYPNKHDKNYKSFKADCYYNCNKLTANKFFLKIYFEEDKLKLKIMDKYFSNIDNSIYWELSEINKRLTTKLNTLAIIEAYPYKKNDMTYYKYVKSNIYELINFQTFIQLIKENKIYITFNIDTHLTSNKYGQIYDHGTAFKIKKEYLNELFKIKY